MGDRIQDLVAQAAPARTVNLEIDEGSASKKSTLAQLQAGKQSEWIPAAAMQPSVTLPCASLAVTEGTAAQPNLHNLAFDTTLLEEAQFQFAFPHRWNQGTVTFKAYYSHVGGQGAGLDGTAWGLSAVSVADDAAWNVAFGTEVLIVEDNVDANDVHITAESAAVTVGGTLGDGNMVFFRIRRKADDAGDDYPGDALLIGIRLFWTQNDSIED
jgi:hypothetical protein